MWESTAGQRGHRPSPGQVVPLKAPPVGRLLVTWGSRRGEVQASRRQAVSRDNPREEVLVSRLSAHLVTYPLEGQM
jgi:hypothetical protein